MKYSQQHRKALGEAFDFISGKEALRLLLRIGIADMRASAAIGKSAREPGLSQANAEFIGALMGLLIAVGEVSVGMGLWAILKMSSILLTRIRRPKYYPHERLRRERLASGRKCIRDRFTTGPCPEPEQLLAQYAKAKTGAREALIFGSMLCDLEAYCDNSLIRNVDGEITGRNPGMKGWIRDNCPELLAHYKNAMRYKGLAEKFRQATGAADPVPAAALAADDYGEVRRLLGGRQVCKITVRMRKVNGPRDGKTVSGTYALEVETLDAARRTAREILSECEGKDFDRPRRGKAMPEDVEGKNERVEDVARLQCGKTRGGVARLEEILDERLDAAPKVAYASSKWRIGGAAANTPARAM